MPVNLTYQGKFLLRKWHPSAPALRIPAANRTGMWDAQCLTCGTITLLRGDAVKANEPIECLACMYANEKRL